MGRVAWSGPRPPARSESIRESEGGAEYQITRSGVEGGFLSHGAGLRADGDLHRGVGTSFRRLLTKAGPRRAAEIWTEIVA